MGVDLDWIFGEREGLGKRKKRAALVAAAWDPYPRRMRRMMRGKQPWRKAGNPGRDTSLVTMGTAGKDWPACVDNPCLRGIIAQRAGGSQEGKERIFLKGLWGWELSPNT